MYNVGRNLSSFLFLYERSKKKIRNQINFEGR